MTELVLQATRKWVEFVVIGLNLCPFAKREWLQKKVRLQVSEAQTDDALLHDLIAELALLKRTPEIKTTLLIHPHALTDFSEYNQFLGVADAVIEQMSLEGVFQIASFHPDYQFAETKLSDAENFTNRSPYPMLHILREESLDWATASHQDTASIPKHNIELLRRLGKDHMLSLLGICSGRDH